MKRETMSFGRSIEYRRNHPHKDRTAVKSAGAGGFDVTFGTWTNRAAMAKTIRMQQTRASESTDWRALVPLTDVEGY